MAKRLQVNILDQDTGNVILVVDVSLNETHNGLVEVTDHPVEVGANITDHLRPKPRELVLEGFVSNTPIVDARSANGSFPPDQPGAAELAYVNLENRRKLGYLHKIITKLSTYENMAITSLSVPRNSGIGEALQFTISFKEVVVITNQVITIKTASPSGKPAVKQGKRVAKPITTTPPQRTVAKKLLNIARGVSP